MLIENYGVTPRSSMNHQKYYRIKDLAEKTGFSTDTIRFYEKKDLIHPNFRGDNNYRYYNEDSLKKLIFIKRCRALEISLSEIQQLIELEQTPSQSCQSVNDLIDDHIAQVSEKIKELISFKQQLIELRASCTHEVNIDSCQILKQLEAD
jgi:Cd(II)/Pb(II)-responsive transcriptional regulator